MEHKRTTLIRGNTLALGDLINTTGNIKATVADRVARGYGIISEIRAIISEVPLGRYKLEIGLQLRQAMFLNGLLYNSEAWHSVTQEDVTALEKLDESLLRFLLGSHAKSPLEMLYLESGATPIKFVLTSRRMNFLHTILKREDEELTKRVLKAQITNPCPGDFIKLVEEDFKRLGTPFDIDFVENSSTEFYKKLVKTKVKNAAFEYLRKLQNTHSKVKHIGYENLATQRYLTSPVLSNTETELLFALRTRTVAGIKANFPNMNTENQDCPLNCWTQGEPPPKDTQQHLLLCSQLNSKMKTAQISRGTVLYEHLFGNVPQQKEATVLFEQLLEIREDLLTVDQPGASLDPSTSQGLCYDYAVLTNSVSTVLSYGK